eukprot:PhM_4_TR5806/c0_g1_i1/m.103600
MNHCTECSFPRARFCETTGRPHNLDIDNDATILSETERRLRRSQLEVDKLRYSIHEMIAVAPDARAAFLAERQKEKEAVRRAPALVHDAESKAHFRRVVADIYRRYNPAKLGDVSKILCEYEGRETELLSLLALKYVHPVEEAKRVEELSCQKRTLIPQELYQ